MPKLTPVITPGNVSIYDPNQYSLNNIDFTPGHTFQRNVEGQADYTKMYTQGTAFGSWQIGFKVRDVIKDSDLKRIQCFWACTAVKQLSHQSRSREQLLGQYQAGPQSKATSILAYYYANQGQFTLDPETATNLQSDFKVNERVYAGYAMNAFTFRRFRFYSGLRVESTNDYAHGYQPDVNNDIVPVNLNNSYTFLLPSASLQYNFGEYTDLRLAYSIAISRPNYSDLAPFLTYTPGTGNTAVDPALTGGNPDLKATWAHNIDLLGSHYFKNIGIIQAGAFYKMLYDYIAQSARQVEYLAPGTSAPALYYESSPLNVGAAHLIGFETSWEQHLT